MLTEFITFLQIANIHVNTMYVYTTSEWCGILVYKWFRCNCGVGVAAKFSWKTFYPIRILWMIWKTAEPQTTKMKSPINQGATGYFSSLWRVDFGTFPLIVTIFWAFSLATFILCLATILTGGDEDRTQQITL